MQKKAGEIRIEDYTYELPEERIARFPLACRDASRLLIYEGGVIRDTCFREFSTLFRDTDTLVFNNTKVIHARVGFQKTTGAAVEVFCLEPLFPPEYARNFAAVGSCEWRCMVGNLKKWKEGEIYSFFDDDDGVRQRLTATRMGEVDNDVVVRFSWKSPLSFSEVLERCGRIPDRKSVV